MGTYIDLNGTFEHITPEQLKKFEARVVENDVPVNMEGDGYFSYSDACGFSFWDKFTTVLQEFCGDEKVCCTVTSECDGDHSTDYFGSDDDRERLNYFDCKHEYENLERIFNSVKARLPPSDIARWTLEKEARP